MQGDVCEAVAAAKADLRAAAGVQTEEDHLQSPQRGSPEPATHAASYAHRFSHAHSAAQVVMTGEEEEEEQAWEHLHGGRAHIHAGEAMHDGDAHHHEGGPMQSDDSDSSNAAMQSSGTTLSLTHPSHSLPHPGSTRLGEEWDGGVLNPMHCQATCAQACMWRRGHALFCLAASLGIRRLRAGR